MNESPIDEPKNETGRNTHGSVGGQIDMLCDRFEAAWRLGERPNIDQYLDGWSEPNRSRVLRELLLLELEYRRRLGDELSQQAYESQFSDHYKVVSEVFDKTSAKSGSAETLPRLPSAARFQPGSLLGDYELLEELGRGGMGVVYRARQTSADRIVALKVIRHEHLEAMSADRRDRIVDRFKTEARAAARLEHDHLVTVFDVGEVDGRHYYSMRFVEGEDLAEIVSKGPLENRHGARYIESVARAVHEAHRHDILHRDLKPANILIDGKTDRALVTDFGLARLHEGDSEMTHAEDLLGSPSYMSPEQATSAANVNALTDVYALGATLYHLITGRPPFQSGTVAQTLDQVRSAEAVSPRDLNPVVDRDLETICLKCLEKESERRYESAQQLANDLQRYLNNEPIVARPIGTLGQVHRWSRRNPAVATLSCIVATSLLVGTLVSTYFAVAATKAADEATQREKETNAALIEVQNQKDRADEERDAARQAQTEAEEARDRVFKTSRIIRGMFAPEFGQDGRKVTVAEVLDRAYERYGKRGSTPTQIKASMLALIGQHYHSLGLHHEAITVLEQACELLQEHAEAKSIDKRLSAVFASLDLAKAYSAVERHDEAIELVRDALSRVESWSKDDDSLDTIYLSLSQTLGESYASANQFAEAIRVFESGLERAQALEADDEHLRLSYIGKLATALHLDKQDTRAIALLEESLPQIRDFQGESSSGMAMTSTLVLARAYLNVGKFDKGTKLYNEYLRLLRSDPTRLVEWTAGAVVERAKLTGDRSTVLSELEEAAKRATEQLGATNLTTLAVERQLALAYVETGAAEKAIPILENTLRLRRSLLGNDDHLTIESINDLGAVYRSVGRLNDTVPLLEEAIALTEQKSGQVDTLPQLTFLRNLGVVYRDLFRMDDAIKTHGEVLERAQNALGRRHSFTITAMAHLAESYLESKNFRDGLRLMKEAFENAQQQHGENHPETLKVLHKLGEAYSTARDAKALTVLEDLVNRSAAAIGGNHPKTLDRRRSLAFAMWRFGDVDDAEVDYRRVIEGQTEAVGGGHPYTLQAMFELGNLYLQATQNDKAITTLESVVSGRKAAMGVDHRRTLAAMLSLGTAYSQAGRFEDAIRVLANAYDRCNRVFESNERFTLLFARELAGNLARAGRTEDAISLYRESLRRQESELGSQDPDTVSQLANLYFRLGRYNEALPLSEELLVSYRQRFGNDDSRTQSALVSLAHTYFAAKEFQSSLPLYREALNHAKSQFGKNDSNFAGALSDYANALFQVGRFDLAIIQYDQLLEIKRNALGADHPETFAILNYLALSHYRLRRFDKAQPLYLELVDLRREKLGDDHVDTVASVSDLANTYFHAGKLDEAFPLYDEALRGHKAKFGEVHQLTVQSTTQLGNAYLKTKRFDEVFKLYKEAIEICKARLGEQHQQTLTLEHSLGFAYDNGGRSEDAVTLYESALPLMQATAHPSALAAQGNLGSSYLRAGQFAKAIPVLETYISKNRKLVPQNDPRFARTLAQVSLELLKHEQFTAAKTYLRECLSIREKRLPKHWSTFHAKCLLGRALAGSAKSLMNDDKGAAVSRFIEAEKLLLDGYAGMKERESDIPAADHSRMKEAVVYLVDLYTSWNKPNDAQEWRNKLVTRSKEPSE